MSQRGHGCTRWTTRSQINRPGLGPDICAPALVDSTPVARVFAIANQKGGVAKTTTTQTVGLALADLGERVLLVDLDPQACLTFALGLEPATCAPTLHDVPFEPVKAGDSIVYTGPL